MTSNPITTQCNDTSESQVLSAEYGLHLKPIAKVHISVQLPHMKGGKSISNWEVMEKLKTMSRPDKFIVLKVVKSALEFIRLEGELESRGCLPKLLAKLDGATMKLSGYEETLKVRGVEAKSTFPSRHDWDSFFRDAKTMNEMKPGERPDTVHISDLPCKWFQSSNHRSSRRDSHDDDETIVEKSPLGKPSQRVVEDIFSLYGDIRCLDIPLLDPYREEIAVTGPRPGSIQSFKYGQDLQFELFIQFKEYMCFVKCMEAFRGMKLMYINKESKAFTANIKVDFDKTKHLSEKSIKKREMERKKIQALILEKERKLQAEREYEERKRLQKEMEARAVREERERRKRERESRRKAKVDRKKREAEEKRIALNIACEERKILIAQRKLEGIRLLSELIDRVKKVKTEEEVQQKEKELVDEQTRIALEKSQREEQLRLKKIEERKRKKEMNEIKEVELREKIAKTLKEKEARREEEEREALRRRLAGRVRLRSAVVRQTWLGPR